MTETLSDTRTDVPEYPMERSKCVPVRAAAGCDGTRCGSTAFAGADLGRQHPVADHRL